MDLPGLFYKLVKMAICFPQYFLKSVIKDVRPSTQGSTEISTFNVTIAFLKKLGPSCNEK